MLPMLWESAAFIRNTTDRVLLVLLGLFLRRCLHNFDMTWGVVWCQFLDLVRGLGENTFSFTREQVAAMLREVEDKRSAREGPRGAELLDSRAAEDARAAAQGGVGAPLGMDVSALWCFSTCWKIVKRAGRRAGPGAGLNIGWEAGLVLATELAGRLAWGLAASAGDLTGGLPG